MRASLSEGHAGGAGRKSYPEETGGGRSASDSVKVGTKVKNIRLTDGDHDIDCRIDGIGQMGLKSEFVKKS